MLRKLCKKIRIRSLICISHQRSKFTPSKGEILVRRATQEDYNDVIGIHKPQELYDGYDPLPDVYSILLTKPSTNAYIATVNGHVAGAVFASLIDNGDTVGISHTRTSAQCKGMGVVTALINNIVQDMCINNNVVRAVTCLDGDTCAKYEKGSLLEGADVILEKRLLQFRSTKQDLTLSLKKGKSCFTTANRLFKSDVHRIFTEPLLRRIMFPEKRLLTSWMPYRLMDSNIPIFITERTLIFSSYLNKQDTQLLTIGTYSHTFNGLLCSIDVFGGFNESFESQLRLQIASVYNNIDRDITVEIAIPETIPIPLFETCMSSLGFQIVKTDEKFKIFCFEKNLKQFI